MTTLPPKQGSATMTSPPNSVAELIRDLDGLIHNASSSEDTVQGVAAYLEDIICGKSDWLPSACMVACPDHYARNLLHRDPDGRYSVIAMVWSNGQGTPIHDHGGLWVVECVYRGKIQVEIFDKTNESQDGVCTFNKEDTIVAGCGQAGALIPPFDYHTIRNPFEEAAVSLHIYGGDLLACDVFEPRGDGLYQREHKDLTCDAEVEAGA